MENYQEKLVLLASEVTIGETDRLDPVFLKVHFKLADNVGNLNGEGVTQAFIDDLIARQEQFDCLPMYVDMDRLLAGDFDNLTHKYQRMTRSFGTVQFGSLLNFYQQTDENGVTSLYAEARFPKRELDACMRLVELFELGRLCVSVEIRYNPEHTILKDGIRFIDAHEDNALTGLAIVSTPACVDAVALDMVASAEHSEIVTESNEPTVERGETSLMDKEENKLTAEIEDQEPVMVAEGEGDPEDPAEETPAEDTPSGDTPGGDTPGSDTPGSDTPDSDTPGGDDSGDDSGDDTPDALINDPSEEPLRRTQAEVLEHSVDTYESVETCPQTGEQVHVIEYHERIIETMEDAGALIAELDTKIAELEEVKSKYDAIIAEAEAKALAEKQAKAQAFAEKQGLDVTVAEVKEAIEALDYAKIAELTMAQAEPEEVAKPAVEPKITLASFVEFEVNNDGYGGLLTRRNK